MAEREDGGRGRRGSARSRARRQTRAEDERTRRRGRMGHPAQEESDDGSAKRTANVRRPPLVGQPMLHRRGRLAPGFADAAVKFRRPSNVVFLLLMSRHCLEKKRVNLLRVLAGWPGSNSLGEPTLPRLTIPAEFYVHIVYGHPRARDVDLFGAFFSRGIRRLIRSFESLALPMTAHCINMSACISICRSLSGRKRPFSGIDH